jgi:hypothetical protein
LVQRCKGITNNVAVGKVSLERDTRASGTAAPPIVIDSREQPSRELSSTSKSIVGTLSLKKYFKWYLK